MLCRTPDLEKTTIVKVKKKKSFLVKYHEKCLVRRVSL